MRNIGAILLYIWFIPFQIILVIIYFIGGIPVWLFKWDKVLYFNERKNQKKWKITKALEKLTEALELNNWI